MPESSPAADAAEPAGLVAQLRATNAGLREVIAGQAARIAELERRLGCPCCGGCSGPATPCLVNDWQTGDDHLKPH